MLYTFVNFKFKKKMRAELFISFEQTMDKHRIATLNFYHT